VTVPGKGGRPRKWRSDTDRVRAYRARQRGGDEPATVEAAAADGDELAVALERERCVAVELANARRAVRALETDLARAEARNDELVRRITVLDADRVRLIEDVAELNERVRRLVAPDFATKRDDSGRPGNRAARRAAQRRQR
jgi:chromosome segregation ATPase